jgi:hypothetical protein
MTHVFFLNKLLKDILNNNEGKNKMEEDTRTKKYDTTQDSGERNFQDDYDNYEWAV